MKMWSIVKIHKIAFIAFIVLTIICFSVYHVTDNGFSMQVFALGVSFYLPVYVCYADSVGEILCKSTSFKKSENPTSFEVTKFIYLFFSGLFFLIVVIQLAT
jgi:uncharacterized oligopeptide transporter (OPT) family protein